MLKAVLKPERLLITLSACFLLLIACGLMSAFLLNQWQSKTALFEKELLKSSQLVQGDITHYLAPLSHKFQQKQCNEDILKAMRISEYHSSKLHEYGFLNGRDLLCTTSRGVFEQPIQQPLPDIIDTNNPIELTKLSPVDNLPNNTKAMRLKLGNFQAFIRPVDFLTLQPQWMDISLFVFNQNGFNKIIGESPTQAISETPIGNTTTLNDITLLHQSCFSLNTCALFEIDIVQYVMDNKQSIATVFGMLSLLFYLSFNRIRSCIKRYFSFNRQVYRGLNEDQVLCYYQPIINNVDRSQSYCEVLCRWRDKQGVIHGAFPFLEEVTANQQNTLFTKILVAKAIKEFRQTGLLGKVNLSVNSFPQDIAEGNIEAVLAQHLSDEEHASIVVEITEQQTGDHLAINNAIKKLHAKGVKVAIDDFGTGHSNLEQLKNLKVDYLKIDQGFVLCMLENPLHLSLVEHIIGLADEMNLTIVAEGVETLAIQKQIEKSKIKYSQGYHHAKPMPLEELQRYFEKHIF